MSPICIPVSLLSDYGSEIETAIDGCITLSKKLDIVVRFTHYLVVVDIYPTTDRAEAIKTYYKYLSEAYSDD